MISWHTPHPWVKTEKTPERQFVTLNARALRTHGGCVNSRSLPTRTALRRVRSVQLGDLFDTGDGGNRTNNLGEQI
jgi:hypothetical protein